MRVLHIEDDAGEARLLQETLKGVPLSARWEGMRAETLQQGLAQVRRGGFDAVLLDLGLPDSQGLATLRAVRQLDPDIPVVVLSGLEDEETALQALRDGAQDYLVKGRFSAQVLVRVLNNSIHRAQIQIRLGDARRHVPRTPGAWSKVRRGGFDAVLLDLGLPDSQGLATLRAVRQLDPDIPVVVLSGLEDEETALQALRDGAQDYLVKGRFSAPVLVRVLNNSIHRAQIQIRLGDARRHVPRTPGAWSKVRLVHVHPAEHVTAINRHIASIGDAGGMVVLACFEQPAGEVRERLHRAGIKTSGILFVDATRQGPLALASDAALDDVALAIESSCDQLGIRSQVVLDSLNQVMERHGARDTVRFMQVVGNRMRALGINLDFVVVDDANGRALSSTCGGAVDTVTTARAPLRGVAAR